MSVEEQLKQKLENVKEELEYIKKCDLTYVTQLMVQKIPSDEEIESYHDIERQLLITQQIVASKIIPLKHRTIILDSVERAFGLLPNYLKAQVLRELSNTLVDTISLRTKEILNMPEFVEQIQTSIVGNSMKQVESMDMECKTRFDEIESQVSKSTRELDDLMTKIEQAKRELNELQSK
tara:strand:- start:641 stop:1177 length:537 start_codon:yes stop_codon:yes gene_type:complete